MEGSFADAANNHHFKRSRWRRLDRQQMQDYLIAACQNVRTMLRWAPQEMAGVAATSFSYSLALFLRFWSRLGGIFLLYSGCFLSNHHELELRSANTGGAI